MWLQARAEVQLVGARAIRPVDVQGLLLWVMADGMNPNWCFVKAWVASAVASSDTNMVKDQAHIWCLCLQNKALISKVVMVGMPGLDAELFAAKKVISQLGRHAI